MHDKLLMLTWKRNDQTRNRPDLDAVITAIIQKILNEPMKVMKESSKKWIKFSKYIKKNLIYVWIIDWCQWTY